MEATNARLTPVAPVIYLRAFAVFCVAGALRRNAEGSWYRSATWFGDVEGKYGPAARVKLPFSVPTLERGFLQLRDEGLLSWSRHAVNPRMHQRLAGPRNFYRNRFGQLEVAEDVIASAQSFTVRNSQRTHNSAGSSEGCVCSTVTSVASRVLRQVLPKSRSRRGDPVGKHGARFRSIRLAML